MASTEQLHALFSATFAADANTRMAAELELRSLEAQNGVLPAAWAVGTNDAAGAGERQAALIWVKNQVRRGWTPSSRDGTHPLGIADKQVLKRLLVPSLATLPARLRVHALTTLLTVVSADFPDDWPNLLPSIASALSSGDDAQIEAGTRALLVVVQSLRWRDEAGRLDTVCATTFPQLVNLAQTLLASGSASTGTGEQARSVGELMHIITKTYARSLSTQLVPHLQTLDSLRAWVGDVLLPIIRVSLDPSQLPEDPDERTTWPWCKAHKWAYVALNRLFLTYGNPTQLPSDKQQYAPFAESFVVHVAPEILRTYMDATERAVAGQAFLPRAVHFSLLNFFLASVRSKTLWALLKPHVQTLIEAFVFPTLCSTEQDVENLHDDPVVFIREEMDPVAGVGQPSSVALQLVEAVATQRKTSVFMPLVSFVQAHLAPGTTSSSVRDGALRMAWALRTTMLQDEVIGPQVENFVSTSIVPLLSDTSEPLLQFRACEVLKRFDQAGLEWSQDASLASALQGVLACLLDTRPDAPLAVQVQAGAALGQLVRHERVQQACASQAGQLMRRLLALTDKTDLDVLLRTQETIVTTFAEELLPVAGDLAGQLRDSLIRLVNQLATVAPKDGNPDSQPAVVGLGGTNDLVFAAVAQLSTMYYLVSAAESHKELLAELERALLPAIVHVLEQQRTELIDELFDLLDLLTFHQPTISREFWRVYELATESLLGWAGDYLSEMIGTVDNFISYGADTIQATPAYQQVLLAIYTYQWQRDADEEQLVSAFKLADVALLNLPSTWDATLGTWVEPTVRTVLAPTVSSAALRRWADVALLDTFIYSAAAALQGLGEHLGAVLDALLDRIPTRFTRPHEMLVGSLAFLSLLATPGHSEVASRAGTMLSVVVGFLAKYPAVAVRQKELSQLLEVEGEEDDPLNQTQAQQDAPDDQDVADEGNALYDLLQSASQQQQLRDARRAAAEAGVLVPSHEEQQEDEDEDGLDDDDAVFESPLAKSRVYDTFRSWWATVPRNEQAKLAAALSFEQQDELQRVCETSDDALAELLE